MPSSPDVEKAVDSPREDAQAKGQSAGMSQSSKDDLGVCIVIILITLLAIVVTAVKIVMIDIAAYPGLFGGGEAEPEDGSSTTTEAYSG